MQDCSGPCTSKLLDFRDVWRAVPAARDPEMPPPPGIPHIRLGFREHQPSAMLQS